jgi:hypothetical protein
VAKIPETDEYEEVEEIRRSERQNKHKTNKLHKKKAEIHTYIHTTHALSPKG